ncbi:hypothetical protein [Anabaena azotica]|uniref:Uncharacterized protein n=1 Tax=Anabaena azotica FACHB-119 TaxID=947527 RepID=A0ABR8DHB1_9NOST|nr:hypothetical protein [Anabaena azotica]MBD2505582.1 hypothetical protein [Anabaena azotica FACHB-119]
MSSRGDRSKPEKKNLFEDNNKDNYYDSVSVAHPHLLIIIINNNIVANLRGFKAYRNGMNTSQRSKLGKNLI